MLVIGTTFLVTAAQTWTSLTYRPAPVDNPLKGLVPYQADVRDRFPHSLEFNYVPYSALVKGVDRFDWQAIEHLLDDIASRGHQAVIRIYLEYPGKSGVIPTFLIESGLKVHRYVNTNTQPFASATVETPDYEDAHLRKSLRSFIMAFGKKYDGDPRLGFITAGLLGTWGEWHTHPRTELFASKAVQEEVMDTYEAAFRVTPILLRYPAGAGNDLKAANAHRRFGYHDDSFAWATLRTGKTGQDWFYMAALKQAGHRAEEKWKTHPIGGEIRPEAWGIVFDDPPSRPEVQDFNRCVQETHVTWLMDSGLFAKPPSADRVARARRHVREMGYEFHVSAVTLGTVDRTPANRDRRVLDIAVEVENRGVAPFYYPWKTEYGLLSENGHKTPKIIPGNGHLMGLLPGNSTRIWRESLDLQGIPSGRYTLAIRVPNSLRQGNPVRFANAEQDRDAPTWCSLGTVDIP